MLICEEANRESFRREGPLSGPPGNPIDKQSGEQLRSHICGSTFLSGARSAIIIRARTKILKMEKQAC